ncbi:hypothetical protein F4604DRAFT_2043590, partial [Suillus subluteus]
WLHLFQDNVSNQSYSASKDLLNKPWRPVPSIRAHQHQGFSTLRWGLMVFCLGFSSLFSSNVTITTAVFTVLVIIPDNFSLSGRAIGKNLLNAGVYVSFELGVTLI